MNRPVRACRDRPVNYKPRTFITSCFYPGCKTFVQKHRQERRQLGLKPISAFQAPKNKDLFQKWKEILSEVIEGKEFGANDRICALHFKEEDIDAFYEVKLSDGTLWRQEKGRQCLKPSAVPCIFPGREPDDDLNDLFQNPGKRQNSNPSTPEQKKMCTFPHIEKVESLAPNPKGLKQYGAASKSIQHSLLKAFNINVVPAVGSKCEIPNVVLKTDLVSLPAASSNVAATTTGEKVKELVRAAIPTANSNATAAPKIVVAKGATIPFTLDDLTEESVISFPWVKAKMRSCVAYFHWNSNMVVERYVVVDKNLHPTVYLKGILSKVLEYTDISSLTILREVLRKVQSIPICKGYCKERSGCRGFIEPTPYRRVCENCRNYQRLQKECGRCLMNSQRLYRKRQLLHCALRKNERMKKKVEKLEKRLNIRKRPSTKRTKDKSKSSSLSDFESDSNISMSGMDSDFSDSEGTPDALVPPCSEEEAVCEGDPGASLVPLMTARFMKNKPSSSRTSNLVGADSLTAGLSGSECEQDYQSPEYAVVSDAGFSGVAMAGLSNVVLTNMKKELYDTVRVNSEDLLFKAPAIIKEEPVNSEEESFDM